MHTIALSSLSTTTQYSLVGLLIGLLLITVIVLMKPMPKNAKYAAMGIMLAVFSLFALTLYQSSNSQLQWDQTQVDVKVPLYNQSLPISDIDWQGAFIADLTIEQELQPKWRNNGMGLPGYSLGWFTLNNDKKALLSVTDLQQVIVLPTNKDYLIMLSVDQPNQVLAELHQQQ
jgi:hypothetical protein